MHAPTGDGDLSPAATDLPDLSSTMRERGEKEEREENEERERDPKITPFDPHFSPRTPPIYNGAWPIIYLLYLFKIITLNYLR